MRPTEEHSSSQERTLVDSLMEQARSKLQSIWGYPDFRSGQKEAIQSVFQGDDTLVLFPTGGGKSLCFQVPAVVLEGVTLVVSPLIALMQDQVDQLQSLGVPATFLNSTLSEGERERRLRLVRSGEVKLVYIAPERLASQQFQGEMREWVISLVAVDEAHCISEWGHDFRPSYRQIRASLAWLDDSVGWIALTGSATPEVKKDMVEALGFAKPRIIETPFARENLTWWVRESVHRTRDVMAAVERAAALGSMILYAPTRAACEQWAARIGAKGTVAKAYHAGLTPEQRKQIQTAWIHGEYPVVVATNAFGMGIDKPDCRTVIHLSPPSTLEAYYQEAGRAGRDGQQAYTLCFYRSTDFETLERNLERSFPDSNVLKAIFNALDSFRAETVQQNLSEDPENPSASSQHKGIQLSMDSFCKEHGFQAVAVKTALHHARRQGVLEWTVDGEDQWALRWRLSQADLLDRLSQKGVSVKKQQFVDTLIRTFGPEAFRHEQYVSVSHLTKTLGVSAVQCRRALQVLSQTDEWCAIRQITGELRIWWLSNSSTGFSHTHTLFDTKAYQDHKARLREKIEFVRGYCETLGCREQYLRTYFGDVRSTPCGRCDRCLANGLADDQAMSSMGAQIELEEAILASCAEQKYSLKALYAHHKSISHADIDGAIQRLLAQKKLRFNEKDHSYETDSGWKSNP